MLLLCCNSEHQCTRSVCCIWLRFSWKSMFKPNNAPVKSFRACCCRLVLSIVSFCFSFCLLFRASASAICNVFEHLFVCDPSTEPLNAHSDRAEWHAVAASREQTVLSWTRVLPLSHKQIHTNGTIVQMWKYLEFAVNVGIQHKVPGCAELLNIQWCIGSGIAWRHV